MLRQLIKIETRLFYCNQLNNSTIVRNIIIFLLLLTSDCMHSIRTKSDLSYNYMIRDCGIKNDVFSIRLYSVTAMY